MSDDLSLSASADCDDHSGIGKLGALIDKAKSKGKKLVASKRDRERERTKTPVVPDSITPCLVVPETSKPPEQRPKEEEIPIPTKSSSDPDVVYSLARRCRNMPFFKYRMTLLGMLLSITIVFPGFLCGLLWGLYLSFIGFLYLFVSDPRPTMKRPPSLSNLHDSTSTEYEKLEQAREADGYEGNALGVDEGVVYRGWMNELKGKYSPATYHVNNAQSVLVRLEGTTLRISRPAKAVLKHAFHEDPTLTQPQPTMVSQTIYSLEGAKVSLRPRRLAQRRWWSRKYPIRIRFSRKPGAVDLSKPLLRSASMNPSEVVQNGVFFSVGDALSALDEGYTAETDSSDESEPDLGRFGRAASYSDMPESMSVSEGAQLRGKEKSIYLFVRAAREKERWFHLLREACAKSQHVRRPLGRRSTCEVNFSLEDTEPKAPTRGPSISMFEDAVYKRTHKQFAEQIALMLGCGVTSPERGSTVSVDLGTMKWKPGVPEENSDLVESINALGTRIFFDFCRDDFWANQVKQKIQSKLATIHLPYFIEKLELSSLSLGSTAPRIVGVYAPKLNEWGIWVDLEMKYSGGIRLVLQTSVNLLKLQSGAAKVEVERKLSRLTNAMTAVVSHYSDEELPESPESSPDEDFGAKTNLEGPSTKERTGKKIISMVERAAQSSFFQKAAKFPKVAKLIEDVSSTPLILNVEVEMLEGPITINIPPPPSDRLWYAFRRPPLASIRAVPQVGDRSVDMTTVSDWIESKLRLLIEKNLVCPNMDDVVLPVMSGNDLLRKGLYNR
ncbi:unnamed protein product [Nippostrongylus brasiliensis]|uniref:Testis-expressed sequence 2 protein (inferred by orthology to a human protein) n=1 Tax=Nippostrongylus brasiliensis TaxID=27835 RepID=A0A0N4Y2I2_NIPBR|nr:unnamed protein product [Nippostrongylus brasiliensis]